MAKGKAETSFWGEFFQARLYKPTQGRIVRQVTALAVAVVFVIAAWRLHSTILMDVGSVISLGGVNLPGSLLRVGLPALVGLLGCWIAYRLVNWPVFANFLISVEAEMDKVSWASLEYLKRATVVVLVLMVFLGAYLFLCDIVWQQVFSMIGFLDMSATAG